MRNAVLNFVANGPALLKYKQRHLREVRLNTNFLLMKRYTVQKDFSVEGT